MYREVDFECSIESWLIEHGGYERGDPKDYDPALGLFPDEVVAFVRKTQPKFCERLERL